MWSPASATTLPELHAGQPFLVLPDCSLAARETLEVGFQKLSGLAMVARTLQRDAGRQHRREPNDSNLLEAPLAAGLRSQHPAARSQLVVLPSEPPCMGIRSPQRPLPQGADTIRPAKLHQCKTHAWTSQAWGVLSTISPPQLHSVRGLKA